MHLPVQPQADKLIGLRLDSAGPDEVTASLTVTEALHQPDGIMHGGVYCWVVETTTSVGAALWLGNRGQVVGVSNHTDFLRAARTGTLRVRALPVHRGRGQQLWAAEVRDDEERLMARGQVRLANLTRGVSRQDG